MATRHEVNRIRKSNQDTGKIVVAGQNESEWKAVADLPEIVNLNADVATAQTKANQAEADAQAAQSTANAAQTKANQAETDAQTAQSTANAAQTTANQAETDAQTAIATANQAQNEVDLLETEVSSKQIKPIRYIIRVAQVPNMVGKTSIKIAPDGTSLTPDQDLIIIKDGQDYTSPEDYSYNSASGSLTGMEAFELPEVIKIQVYPETVAQKTAILAYLNSAAFTQQFPN